MRAGRLRQSVTVQRWDGSAWADDLATYAEIIPTGASGEGAAMNFTVSLRYGTVTAAILPTSELQPTHRLQWGSRILDIFEAINVEQNNREIRLLCRELPVRQPD